MRALALFVGLASAAAWLVAQVAVPTTEALLCLAWAIAFLFIAGLIAHPKASIGALVPWAIGSVTVLVVALILLHVAGEESRHASDTRFFSVFFGGIIAVAGLGFGFGMLRDP